MVTMTRPLRADAERNRLAILQAARELFALRGFDVPLDDIAAHAGVGVGTLYRRFPNRDELVNDLATAHMEDALGLLEAASERPDAWNALTETMEQLLSTMVRDRAILAGVECAFQERPGLVDIEGKVQERFVALCIRAQEQGDLRADAAPSDFFAVFVMIRAAIDYSEPTVPGTWRRYAELMFAGLSTAPHAPFTVPAMSLEQAATAKRASKCSADAE